MEESKSMSFEAQAEWTLELTRKFYKHGGKSNNKSYRGTGPAWSRSFFGASTPKIEIEPGAILSNEQKARNAKTLKNMKDMYLRSNTEFKGRTPFDIGQTLYQENDTQGNCGEMAAVAVYLAVRENNVPADEVSLCSLTNKVNEASFSHNFAVLGTGPNRAARWVVDPWAAVCCSMDKYGDKLTKRLNDWLINGKRIAAETSKGNVYWVEPTNDMVTGILTTWLGREVKANQKVT